MAYKNNADIIRSIVPNFNDPRAVLREYVDSAGDLQKIEVFYGGKYGGDSEGHGHWVAEKIGGLFQVTLDREPDRSGGRHVIESNHRTNAYNDELRQARIRAKQAVISELHSLTPNTPGLGGKVKELSDKLYACGSCGHDDNERLKSEFKSIADALFKERDRIRGENKLQKELLVQEAERLAYSTDFKKAKEDLKRLQERWKLLPRASKDDEAALWARFKRASDTVYENAKRDFENRQRQQQDAKAKKERVIFQIESLLGTSDFRSASDEVKRLSDEFYNAGSAGKDNQALKERFNAAKDRFYSAKKAAAEQKHREYIQNLQDRIYRKKEALSRLENAIYNKQQQLSELMSRPSPSFNNPHCYEIVSRRNARESQLQSAISDMQMKKSSIVNEIAELQSKLNNSI